MYKPIVAMIFCMTLSSATPSPCRNGYMAVTADFDDIKSPNQDTIPKDGYAGLSWSKSNYVQMTPSTFNISSQSDSHTFAGSSAPNSLRARSQNIAFQTVDASMFSLKSFALACYTYISDVLLQPERCSFLVTVGGNYDGVNTYEFDYKESDDKKPTFQTFKGVAKKGEAIQIQLVGQPVGKYPLKPGTVLVVDNLVTMQQC